MIYRHSLLFALCLALSSGGTITAQTVHEVGIAGDRAEGRFRFDPARTTVVPGDIVRFVVQSGQPHSIVFDSTGLSPADRSALNEAIPERMSLLSGPILTQEGQVLEIRVPPLSPGTYRFYCLPHLAYRAEGVMVVEGG
jgi:plastocyanin